MPHDKIKAIARARMARTGEPYVVARRAVIREHQAAQAKSRSQEPAAAAFEAVAAQLAGHAEEVQAQLVHASGITEIERRFVQQLQDAATAPVTRAVQQLQDAATAPVTRAVQQLQDAATAPVTRAVQQLQDAQLAADALGWFRGLGHKVVGNSPDIVDGPKEWRCARCGSSLMVTRSGRPVSSSGNARCIHEGADW
jgi:hypothetical protein